jgi:phage terminase large subunit
VPVDVSWDIGVGDATSLWFSQRLGNKTRLVGYFEASGEGLRFYVDQINRMAHERGWKIGDTLWPHDGRVREWGSGKSRMEQFREATHRHRMVVPALSLDDGIAAVRAFLPNCEFDVAACSEGLKALRAYRKEWDEESGCWRDKPRHDWSSHGADAFRVLASRYRYVEPTPAPKPRHDTEVLMVQADGKLAYVDDGGVVDFRDVVRRHCERKERERQRDSW